MNANNTGTWVQNTEHPTDQWDIVISGSIYLDNRIYGHITQYEGSDSYCWQAVRGEDRLSGIAVGREAAMAMAEETLALPVEEFNSRIVAEYVDTLRALEKKILRLSPASDLLPGYHAGYEAGAADIKRRLSTLLEA